MYRICIYTEKAIAERRFTSGRLLLHRRTTISKQVLLYSINPFRIEQLLFQRSYIFKSGTFSEELLFGNSTKHPLFQKAAFSEMLLSQKSYFFTTSFFRRSTFSQLHFLSTATLPIHQLVIKGFRHQLRTFITCDFFLVYLLLLNVTSQSQLIYLFD